MPLRGLEGSKINYVHVYTRGWQNPFTYTCYDLGVGVWKEQDGMGWAHVVALFRHPAAHFEPRWTPTVALEHIERVEIISMLDFMKFKLGAEFGNKRN